MKISVIIPTYKPGDYIFQCLDSIKEQTLDAALFEVIVVLNGCDEPWHSQLTEYLQRQFGGHCVRLIQTDSPGVSNARNIGINEARGEYIAFIDDDDYISPQYLEELLHKSTPSCIALSDSLYVNDATGEISADNSHHKRFEANRAKAHPSLYESRVFFNGPCMKLIHRDIIGLRRFDARFANGEDNLMMMQISDRVRTVCYTTSDAIYYRRIRENSATTRRRSRARVAMNSLEIMAQYVKYLAKNPFGYNYPFVLSRFAAAVKSIILR